MNAGRAVALALGVGAHRAARPVPDAPLVSLTRDRARALALALAAPVVEPSRPRPALAATPALEPTALA